MVVSKRYSVWFYSLLFEAGLFCDQGLYSWYCFWGQSVFFLRRLWLGRVFGKWSVWLSFFRMLDLWSWYHGFELKMKLRRSLQKSKRIKNKKVPHGAGLLCNWRLMLMIACCLNYWVERLCWIAVSKRSIISWFISPVGCCVQLSGNVYLICVIAPASLVVVADALLLVTSFWHDNISIISEEDCLSHLCLFLGVTCIQYSS